MSRPAILPRPGWAANAICASSGANCDPLSPKRWYAPPRRSWSWTSGPTKRPAPSARGAAPDRRGRSTGRGPPCSRRVAARRVPGPGRRHSDIPGKTLAELGEPPDAAETFRPSVSVGTLCCARSRLLTLGQSPSECCDPCLNVAGNPLALPDIDDPVARRSVRTTSTPGLRGKPSPSPTSTATASGSSARWRTRSSSPTATSCASRTTTSCSTGCTATTVLTTGSRRPRRARLTVKVLGLRDPQLAARSASWKLSSPGLLDTLLDAINDNCDRGLLQEEPRLMDAFRLEVAVI